MSLSLLERRSGLDLSEFRHDDALQQFCARRLHAWAAAVSGSPVRLHEPSAGEYGFDAQLSNAAGTIVLSLEYKWDRHALRNLASEIVAKDRGNNPQLGYLLKQTYDWLAYTYVCEATPVMFLMEAQCVRKYIFQFWRERGFGAAHCQNRNRARTAAWNLLVPVEEMHAFLAQFGMSYRVALPRALFDPETPETALATLASGRDVFLHTLDALLAVRRPRLWRPSAQHWHGLVSYMLEHNARRKSFNAAEVSDSQVMLLDWLAMGRAQGLIHPEGA
jgi:hypothetical protein